MNAAYTGNQIAARRKELGMTQKELAEKLHVTDKAVSKWERGINFPDLCLMEALAGALGTTPAALLGLEEASRDEIVSSVTQISNEQLETAQRDIRWCGWGCLAAGALLAIAYGICGERTSFQILIGLICAAAVGGIWLLIRYGQIRKFDIPEIFILYCAVFPTLIYLGIQFITGHNPHPVLGFCLIAATSCSLQLLFHRIMKPDPAKALPLILSALFALWRIPREFPFQTDVLIFALPAACCLIVWGICIGIELTKGTMKPIPLKTAAVTTLVCILLLSVFFYTPLVRTYVLIRHEHLEDYARSLLADNSENYYEKYGFWDVSVYPEAGMVEFLTGGSGLVPSSTYEGFYYSAGDVHLPFQNAEIPMRTNGDTAYWDDGTDNWGKSARIREGWFWYEAHF